MKKMIIALGVFIAQNFAVAQLMYLPSGSDFEQDGLIWKFNVSPNYTYVGTREDGIISKEPATKGWISCTCNSSGKCLPGKYGDLVGCGGDCSNCTLKQGKITIANEVNPEINFISGGLVDFSSGIRIATKADIGSAGIFDELLDLPEVSTELKKFINEFSKGEPVPEPNINADGSLSAPLGYVLQPILIFGRGCLIVLPEGAGNELAINSTSKTSCSCTKGNCTLKTRLGASYCDGECTGSCKLSWNVNSGESLNELFVFSKF